MVLMVARPGADWYEPENVEGQNRNSMSVCGCCATFPVRCVRVGAGPSFLGCRSSLRPAGAGISAVRRATRGANHVGDHAAEAGVRQCSDRACVAPGELTPPRCNEMTPPVGEFRVELLSPDGSEMWEWGRVGAEQTVTGPAEDFCLLITQRAHRADLCLVATGAGADAWLDRAQAFAGSSGEGRRPAGSTNHVIEEDEPHVN